MKDRRIQTLHTKFIAGFVSSLFLFTAGIQFLLFPFAEYVDLLSMIAEATISVMLFAILLSLRRLKAERRTRRLLYSGFALLMTSMITDSLDDVLLQPMLVTFIFEDFFQMSGFLILVFAIRRWIRLNNDQTERLRMLANTDDLTETLLRRAFYEQATVEFRKFLRTKHPYCILLIDIDFFKQVNDTYGHDAGDAVLKAFAKQIKLHTRNIDILCRWGGEEFVLLLVDTDLKTAKIVAEKLRGMVETMHIPFDSQKLNITASIGISETQLSDHSIDQAISRADKLLYQAKSEGRNKVFG